jgi:hypothetical protein
MEMILTVKSSTREQRFPSVSSITSSQPEQLHAKTMEIANRIA